MNVNLNLMKYSEFKCQNKCLMKVFMSGVPSMKLNFVDFIYIFFIRLV